MKPTFSGEAMLAGWSESHNGGAKITFWLSDPSDLDAFRGMTIAKGKTAGQRLAMVLVEIAEDETVKESAPAIEKPKGGELAKLAGILCSDPKFCEWLDVPDEEGAAAAIRATCGVASRADLDHNPKAAALFHERIRKPWAEVNR